MGSSTDTKNTDSKKSTDSKMTPVTGDAAPAAKTKDAKDSSKTATTKPKSDTAMSCCPCRCICETMVMNYDYCDRCRYGDCGHVGQ
ncbi:uncharacterized protein FTOL_03066 [Fusarium torulosum]|uniref:Uncharacterized protein n=1 Tax=Fusarium torulosum TaxID=33205 RepID=A0AAE8SF80_9HYPO|nr:uncharacterized protein FTOL_03066 [Fusarium torulosum]